VNQWGFLSAVEFLRDNALSVSVGVKVDSTSRYDTRKVRTKTFKKTAPTFVTSNITIKISLTTQFLLNMSGGIPRSADRHVVNNIPKDLKRLLEVSEALANKSGVRGELSFTRV
jgi:hypothetical protein